LNAKSLVRLDIVTPPLRLRCPAALPPVLTLKNGRW